MPKESLLEAPVVDYVARNEFDFTVKDVADGIPFKDILGISYRNGARRDRAQ